MAKNRDRKPASVTLRLYAVWEYTDESGWYKSRDEFYRCWRAYQQHLQWGAGNVFLYIRELREQGKTRFATKEEKKRKRFPAECYPEDLDRKIYEALYTRALAKSGIHSRIYTQAQRMIIESELSGAKLASLLRGDINYPRLSGGPMPIYNGHWHLEFEEREAVRDGKSYTFRVPVVHVKNLFPKGRPVAFEAWAIKGKGGASKRRVLEALAAGEKDWHQGTVQIRRKQRPGQPVEWSLMISYAKKKVEKRGQGKVVVIHRGVANALHATAITPDGIYHDPFVGDFIVKRKRQFSARRGQIRRDASIRDRKKRNQHMARLRVEKDCRRKEIGDMVRWAQNFVEKHQPKYVILEKFGAFHSDLRAPNGHKIPPYIRNWPFGEVKLKIQDALERRAEVALEIYEVDHAYISRTCPLCEHEDRKNIRRYPSTAAPETRREGFFRCTSCGLSLELESVATLNMALRCEEIPKRYTDIIKQSLRKLKKHKAAAKAEAALEVEGTLA